ncbi:unnamed protein product, partial [marine sediment metagenome]
MTEKIILEKGNSFAQFLAPATKNGVLTAKFQNTQSNNPP